MRYRHRVLSLLFLLSIITYLDRVCIAAAGPEMQRDLGLSQSQWGWVVGIFALSYAAFEIPSGAMGDRYGPRVVLTRIVLWWSAFTTITGFVSSYSILLIVRFLFGAGEAGAYPNSSSSISRWFPLAERGRAHGTVWMASRIGGALTPLLVYPILAAFGWRTCFFIFGSIGVIWCAVWYWWYRDLPPEKPGVTSEELAEIGPTTGRAHEGLPWGIALRSANLWRIMLMYHTYCWGSYFYLSWLHTYLAKGRGFSGDELKLFSMLPFVAGALGNFTGGVLSDFLVRRFGLAIGRKTVGAAGLAMSAVCIFGTGVTADRYVAVALLTFGYFSMDCMLPVSWSLCLDIGRRHAGAVTGTMNMAGQIGSFLSSVAFGIMVDYFGGRYDIPLMLFGAMLAVSAILYTTIDPTEELIPEIVPQTVPVLAS
ncbi:MAG: MFS transporter [Bryobacteraceae bacterium]|nr:MFS transporter [Bryobacteraceae bacterium]